MVGKKFGKVKVLGYTKIRDNSGTLRIKMFCKCDCGVTKEMYKQALFICVNPSCGCGSKNTRFVRKNGSHENDTYGIWVSMRARCRNPRYRYYSQRGIKVSKEWEDFETFKKDMGERPVGYSIERIDSNGDYCKENCRWASSKEQAYNRRTTVLFKYEGRLLNSKEIQTVLNKTKNQIKTMVKVGKLTKIKKYS